RRAEEHSLELQRRSAEILVDEGLSFCRQGDVAKGMLCLAQSLELAPGDDPVLQRQIRFNLAGWSGRLVPLRAILPHQSRVHCAVFSPDGSLIATASEDGTARAWNAET